MDTYSTEPQSMRPGSIRRWGAIGVGAAVVALVGWYVASADHRASPVHVAAAPRPSVAPAPAVPAAVAAPQRIVQVRRPAAASSSDLAILRSASREELLAYGRDLLAHGGPLENIVALLEFLVNDRPEMAIDLARDIGRTNAERQVFLYAALSAWADKDAPAALQWAVHRSDSYDIPGNASLLYVVLEEIAANDPASAIAATDKLLERDSAGSAGPPRKDVARFTLEALIRTGHRDVAQQAIQQWSHGAAVRRLDSSDFEIVAMALAQDSFGSAGEWLAKLPSSPARNEAYLPFANTWARQDIAAAMDWAQRLNPADGGDDVRVATFARWLKVDRPAATQWLFEHNSPDPTRLLFLLNAPAVAGTPSAANAD